MWPPGDAPVQLHLPPGLRGVVEDLLQTQHAVSVRARRIGDVSCVYLDEGISRDENFHTQQIIRHLRGENTRLLWDTHPLPGALGKCLRHRNAVCAVIWPRRDVNNRRTHPAGRPPASTRARTRTHTAVTHLEGAFLSRLLAVTFQHLPVDAQAEDLRRDRVVVRHRVSPKLQLTAARGQEVSGARLAPGWIRRLLLLVLLHFDSFISKNRTAKRNSVFSQERMRRSSSSPVYWNSLIPNRTRPWGTQPNKLCRAAVKRPPLHSYKQVKSSKRVRAGWIWIRSDAETRQMTQRSANIGKGASGTHRGYLPLPGGCADLSGFLTSVWSGSNSGS